jgi:hypothetical protein
MPELYHTKKDAKSSYDPQIGEAAKASAALADRSVKFSEDFYNQHIAPLLDAQTQQSATSAANENALFASNMADMQQQRDRYNKYGIPAEDRYYKMANEYSSADEEQKQAGLAIGDVRAANAGAASTMNRQLASLGIDPTSPAAIAARNDNLVMGAAAEAGAANRARQAAKTLGMQISADAANFGRGGTSQVLGFGGAASGNTQGALGAASTGLAGANSSAGVVQSGYGLGLKGYAQNLDAFTSRANAQTQANAQSAAGFGKLLGTAAGFALGVPGG